jgi:D-aspartate ligase
MTNTRGHLFDTSTPAVVLKLTPNVMHHGVLGVTRSLGRVGVPVYGVHEGSWAPAASSRYLAGRFFWQANANDADRLTEGLLRLAAHIGRPAVLFATDDAGALFLAEHGSDLRRWFLFPNNPTDLPRKLADKYSLYKLCREQGIPCPLACIPESFDAARVFARSVGYPLIIKLISPWIADWRLPSTSVVLSEHDLSQMYDHCKQFDAELMLQEFIPGSQGHDWFFHGYCDTKSVCRPTFTGIKERSFPVRAGRTTFGRSAENEKLRGEIIGLLTRIGYRGIMDIDVRLDARDGQYNVLDFNPRLGAQFRIFEDTAGVDVALAAYLDLTGQAIPTGEQLNDRTFMVESYDPMSALANWRQGRLSLGSWLSSLRALDEVAWFASDDLRPFGLMCVRMSWKFISRPFIGTSAAIHSTTASPPICRYRPGRASSGKIPRLVMRSTVL